ncbi:MAG: hypothetical protein ABIG11_01340 [bacterium]
MTPNPILKVLSILGKNRVKSLLIGGQACIIYGAAEFSRDSDFVVLATAANLGRLRKALGSLKAEQIYVPKLEIGYLERGHACHFRCAAGGVKDLRIDVMTRLRGCESFDKLWERRTVVSAGAVRLNVMGLRDLVQSKKTQRDKDWLMIRLLVENDILVHGKNFSKDRLEWWLMEARTSERLIGLCARYPEAAEKCVRQRPLMAFARDGDIRTLNMRLLEEEHKERLKDTAYWEPLKRELEFLRRRRVRRL